MSMIEPGRADDPRDADEPMVRADVVNDALPRFEASLVPTSTLAGHALVAVIAIMTFLASLTTGGVVLMRGAASDWQSEVSRELTIQIRPASDRDIEADVARAAAVARGFAGIADVRPYSKEESTRLLEPWLGTDLALDDLPVPRIIAVRMAPGALPDLPQLRNVLAQQVPVAGLDDHRSFVDRMRSMARTAVIGGGAVLVLVLIATVLSVMFATRGAIATNRQVIEVLHFIGAKNAFIAGQFQRRFLVLGLKGGMIGGGCAVALFALAEFAYRWFPATAGSDQLGALFGSFAIGLLGYGAVLAQVVLIAVVTAATSRQIVNRTLEAIQ